MGVPQSTDTRRKSSLKLFKNSDFNEISELLFKVPISSCVTPVPLLSEDLTDRSGAEGEGHSNDGFPCAVEVKCASRNNF